MNKANNKTTWRTNHRASFLVVVLFFIAFINYVDRQSLSVLATRFQDELHMNDLEYARIVGLFLLAYAIAHVIVGFIADGLGTRRTMALFVCVWSLAEAATAFATNTLSLSIARFCLGIGEPGFWVTAPKAVAEAFEVRFRALAIGIYCVGSSAGAVIALPAIVLITHHLPWRCVFLIDGAVGLFLTALWLWGFRSRQDAEVSSTRETQPKSGRPAMAAALSNLRVELTHSRTWKLVVARGLTDPVWYFYLFWFPKYLMTAHHLTLEGVAHFAWFVYFLAGIGAVTSGLFASLLIHRGQPARIAYRWTMLAAALVLPLSFLTAVTSSTTIAILVASLIAFAHMNWMVTLAALVVELYPATRVGTVAGLMGTGSALGGMMFSGIMGFVVVRYGYTPLISIIGFFHPLMLVLLWRLFEERVPVVVRDPVQLTT